MATKAIRERCTGCGAAVDLEALTCGYCGAPSPHAVRARNAADQAALEREEAALKDARAQLDKRATNALIWSVVGVLVCCMPVPGLVGVLKARGVAKEAKARGFVPPSTATVALVFGVLNLVTSAAFWIFFAFEMRAVSQRKAELHAAVADEVGRPQLEQQTACALAELRLLEDGWADHETGSSGMSDTFECAGRLEQDGERATLRAISFRLSGEERTVLDACLERGARWHVVALVPSEAGCAEAFAQ